MWRASCAIRSKAVTSRIQADLDGNGTSDFEIVVNNNTILSGSDFFFSGCGLIRRWPVIDADRLVLSAAARARGE